MTCRRGNVRQRKRIPLRFGADVPNKVAFTDDITREGLFIRTAQVANPGTRLMVELSPPEGNVVLEVEVRWGKRIPPNMLHKLKGGIGVKIMAFHKGESIYQKICDLLYPQPT